MTILPALFNVSEPLQHAFEVVAQVVTEQLSVLTTKEQNEFWTELHGYALASMRHKARPALIAAPQVEESVRRALQLTDEQIRTQLERLNADDQERFWELLHESAAHAMEETGIRGRFTP